MRRAASRMGDHRRQRRRLVRVLNDAGRGAVVVVDDLGLGLGLGLGLELGLGLGLGLG